jgi:ATP-binding cassette subfamily F protein 3
LENIAVGEIRTKLRDILAEFLFRGEDIDKKVSVLSGGERARLGMAKLMLEPYNLLALDEPTNHMDIKSKDILKQALKSYDGTLIVVSHDRDFLEGLVDKMYEFRDGKVTEHLGSVHDFLEKRKLENLHELERRFGSQASREPSQKKIDAQNEFQQKRSDTKEERKIKNRIALLENEIDELEKSNAEIEKKLSSPQGDDVMKLAEEYQKNKNIIDEKTSEWEELMNNLENNTNN